jgi:hypothetical protein
LIKRRGEDGLLDINAIAETYLAHLPSAALGLAHEVDLRPFKEPF